MLKYEDYAKARQENLEGEIDDASRQSQERANNPENSFEVPDRFQGKSFEDVVQSYQELEKAYGRMGNDLGAQRKLTDELLRASESAQPATPPQAEKLTIDDLYEDPEGAVQRAAANVHNDRIAALEAQIANQQVEQAKAALNQSYPDWQNVIRTPEFQNWVAEAPYRARLIQQADQHGDFGAANDVLGMYWERAQGHQQEQQRQQALRDGSLESGSPDQPSSDEKISRSQLLDIRIRAKRGDPEATAWLNANNEAIAIAYEEGRIVD